MKPVIHPSLILAVLLCGGALLVATSCRQAQPAADTVRVGMPLARALHALRSHGATETEMAVIGGPRSSVWSLPDGRVVVVDGSATGRAEDATVTYLELCTHPERPKVERDWQTVAELPLP